MSYIFLLVGRVCNRVIFNLSTTFHRCPQVDCCRLKRELHPFIPLFPTKCYLLPNFASTLYSKMHNQAFFLVFCPRLDFSRQGNNAHLTCNQFWCSILIYLSLQIFSVSMAHIQMLFNVDVLPENEEQKNGKVLIDLEEKFKFSQMCGRMKR